MKKATLIGGPLDGLEVEVEDLLMEYRYSTDSKVWIYRTYAPEGKTFNLIEQLPLPISPAGH